MPSTPVYTKCQSLGCPNPKTKLNSFCHEHGGRNYAPRETDSIYQTPAWRSVRQRQLSIQPLCQGCLSRGRVEAAKHVDHLFPWRQVGKHAFLNNVFQSLCGPCHSYKTGQEKHGVIEHYTPTGVEHLTIDDYAMRVRVNP